MIGCYLEVALLASFCTASSEYLALCERMWEQPGVHSGRIDKSKRAYGAPAIFRPKAHLDSVRVLRMSRCRSRVLTAGHMCTGDIDRSPLIEAGIYSIAAGAPRELRVVRPIY